MDMHYLAVGNPTVDFLPDGREVIGGTVVYAAVQAARLEMTARVIGNANRAEIDPLLPADDRIVWDIRSAPVSTKFTNISEDGVRHQLIHASAGPVEVGTEMLKAGVVHLGPVDAEVDFDAVCAAVPGSAFVGATPQGAFRTWGEDQVVQVRPQQFSDAVVGRVNAVVVGSVEAEAAAQLLDGVVEAGGIAVVTRGSQGCEVRTGPRRVVMPAAAAVDEVDDTGAGDVFAAALFMKLAAGVEVDAAVRFAQAAASASVRGVATDAIADAATIEEMLAAAAQGSGRTTETQ